MRAAFSLDMGNSPAFQPKLRLYLMAVLFGVIVAFAYRPTATFFSQDDFWFLDRVRRADNLSSFFASVGATDYFYRPVPRVLLLKLEYLLFDLQPFGYHAFGWLLHIANSSMVFGLWRMLWRNDLWAFLAALYYGLHYVHFVPVTWASGQQELSVVFWSLLSLFAYVHSRKFSKRCSLGLSWLAFGLALFSKEIGVTVLIWIILVDLVEKPKTWSAILLNKGGYLVVLLGFLWIRMLKVGGLPPNGPYAWRFDPSLLWHNIRWYVLESVYLREWTAGRSMIMSLAVLTLGGVLFWIVAVPGRHRQPLIVGTVGFATALLPVAFLDRTYSYYLCFPLLGFSLMFALIADFAYVHLLQRIRGVELQGKIWARSLGWLALTTWVVINLVGLQYVGNQDPLGLRDKARISQRTLERVSAQYPYLPNQSTLYIQGASERDFWALGKGSLFRLYYYPQSIEVLFDLDTPLTADLLDRPNFYVYDFGQE